MVDTVTIPRELSELIENLRRQVESRTEKVERLEPPASPKPGRAAEAAVAEGITEEEILAISAAVAAYLGFRGHIRQIRLVSSRSWAQEGRVSIQASHRLHG